MSNYVLLINGRRQQVDVVPDTPLLWVLRDTLDLPGTKFGCGAGHCGACTVQINGVPTRSCMTPVSTVGRKQVTTIEGLAQGGKLHPMQEAFREHHGLQCGFCTPGMIMAAVDMVNRKGKDLDEATIRHELEGNICRCTGYHNIVAAVKAGAANM